MLFGQVSLGKPPDSESDELRCDLLLMSRLKVRFEMPLTRQDARTGFRMLCMNSGLLVRHLESFDA